MGCGDKTQSMTLNERANMTKTLQQKQEDEKKW